MTVERPGNLETTSLGAAYAAGIGAGIWTEDWVLKRERCGPDTDDGDPWMPPEPGRSFEPAVSAADVDVRYGKWRKAVARSLEQDDLVDET